MAKKIEVKDIPWVFDTPVFDHTIVQSENDLSTFYESIDRADKIAFDFETTGLHFAVDEPVGMGIADARHAWYFPEEFLVEISPWIQNKMKDPKILWIGHNIIFDMHFADRFQQAIPTTLFDTMVAKWLIDEECEQGLKDAVHRDLKYTGNFPEFSDLLKYTKALTGVSKMDDVDIRKIPLDKMGVYGAFDARATYDYYTLLLDDLKEADMLDQMFNIEMPFVHVLYGMEKTGIAVDLEFAQQLNDQYSGDIIKLNEQWDVETKKLMGEPVNYKSPLQLRELLYGALKLKTNRKTKSGEKSTDALTLIQLKGQDKSGLVSLLTKIKEYDTIMSTFINQLINNTVDGRMYAHFNHTGTVTGRLSSSGVKQKKSDKAFQLQNIPMRTELGKQVRRAFIASSNMRLLVSDYSQIELRIAAHVSGDWAYRRAFLWGADPHQLTANMLGIDRAFAKSYNFAVVYLASARTLCNTIEKASGVRPNLKEVEYLLEEFYDVHPAITEYQDEIIREAKLNGKIALLGGRYKHANMNALNNHNDYIRSREERRLVNGSIQGPAGNIMKLAMLRLAEIMGEYGAKMILQVHDEVGFEGDADGLLQFKPIVKEIMESIGVDLNLSVPLIADPAIGRSWLEAK